MPSDIKSGGFYIKKIEGKRLILWKRIHANLLGNFTVAEMLW